MLLLSLLRLLAEEDTETHDREFLGEADNRHSDQDKTFRR